MEQNEQKNIQIKMMKQNHDVSGLGLGDTFAFKRYVECFELKQTGKRDVMYTVYHIAIIC